MMTTGGKRRKISPCKDREAVYEMMAGWSDNEVNKVAFFYAKQKLC
jgi:hypothetical protein